MKAYFWIVISDGRPLARYSDGKFYARSYATAFRSWADANQVRHNKRMEFIKLANAAPSIESPVFKMWAAKADAVRTVRVEIEEAA